MSFFSCFALWVAFVVCRTTTTNQAPTNTTGHISHHLLCRIVTQGNQAFQFALPDCSLLFLTADMAQWQWGHTGRDEWQEGWEETGESQGWWRDPSARGGQGWWSRWHSEGGRRLHGGCGWHTPLRDVTEVQVAPGRLRVQEGFCPEQTLHVVCPHSYNDLVAATVWGPVQELAEQLGGKIAHRMRKSLTNVVGGYGNYKVTFMGSENARLLNCFMEKLVEYNFDTTRISRPAWEGDQSEVTPVPSGIREVVAAEFEAGGGTPALRGEDPPQPSSEPTSGETLVSSRMLAVFLEALKNTAEQVAGSNMGIHDTIVRDLEELATRRVEVQSGFRVGLATTCRGRLAHLKTTLPWTQWLCMRELGRFQQAVVVWEEDKEAIDWILGTMEAPLRLGTLVVGLTQERYFHACKWKNAAARLVSERCDVVVNLDASRILGLDFPCTALRVPWTLEPPEDPKQERVTGCLFFSQNNSGTFGTIGAASWAWWLLGGYDEDFLPMGCQDTDLLRRLRAVGEVFRVDQESAVGHDIGNTSEDHSNNRGHQWEKVAHVDPEYGNLRWGQMDQRNRTAMEAKFAKGEYTRNQTRDIAPCRFLVALDPPESRLVARPQQEAGDMLRVGAEGFLKANAGVLWPSLFKLLCPAQFRGMPRGETRRRFEELMKTPALPTQRLKVFRIGGETPTAAAAAAAEPTWPAPSAAAAAPAAAEPAPTPAPPASSPKRPRVAEAKREVVVYTLGVFTLHQVVACTESGQLLTLAEAHANTSALVHAVKGALSANGTGVSVVVDARPLKESRETLIAQQAWDHCGLNPRNLARIVAHARFSGMARDCLERCRPLLESPSTEGFGIAVFCNAGRDRSVGFATVLQHLLSADQRCQVVVKHLCQPVWRWHSRRSVCGVHCEDCFGRAAMEARQEAFQQASGICRRSGG